MYLYAGFTCPGFVFTDLSSKFVYSLVPDALYSYYGLSIIFGGFNSWSKDTVTKMFTNLNVHNKIFIKFKLYQVDNWESTDNFNLIIDGVSKIT